MILNVFSGFCICDEICKHPNWVNFEQVIFKNESYRYSHHYHYSQTINLNQPRPNVNGSFIEYKKIQPIKPEFPLKYFESEVSKFEIWPSGVLYMFKKDEKIGQISNNLGRSLSRQLLDESEFLELFSCSLFCLPLSYSFCIYEISPTRHFSIKSVNPTNQMCSNKRRSELNQFVLLKPTIYQILFDSLKYISSTYLIPKSLMSLSRCLSTIVYSTVSL
ncbi:hypothetical protein MS3_00003558 [Schistosoma haematobium]|uniref:Uncharacterized protein n=1 Tax=Schistosoma haematobium TaxID=6185 RepID=A0A922LTR4_SCHHA|nr:hypothetical protein MS3_00003558 [Schistosoma haematobium]KAH9593557.1 hypothetical protein MS3_00003558 [Schistosoma haematobium]